MGEDDSEGEGSGGDGGLTRGAASLTFLVAAAFTLAAGTFSGLGPALRMGEAVGVRLAWGVGAGEGGSIDCGTALALVGMEVLDVEGGAGDDMGVGMEDGLGAEGLGPALRKGGGVGRTGLGLEIGLGMKYWGLGMTAGWLSVGLRALAMYAGNENSWLLLGESTTRIELSAVLWMLCLSSGLCALDRGALCASLPVVEPVAVEEVAVTRAFCLSAWACCCSTALAAKAVTAVCSLSLSVCALLLLPMLGFLPFLQNNPPQLSIDTQLL